MTNAADKVKNEATKLLNKAKTGPVDNIKVDINTSKTVFKYRRELQFAKVPKLSSPWHIICFILNVFTPGIGTILAALVTKSATKRKWNLLFGVLQLVLAAFIIGWLWSVVWGLLMLYRNKGVLGKVPDAVFEQTMK
ncbi:hypothetical protein AKO1_009775 [Acrasis kona]|uniref:Uncharacterized protein n=1 Tax=Acrasis kona TaxID=1008807 RepID=A0AAW2ZQ95_9EUKA